MKRIIQEVRGRLRGIVLQKMPSKGGFVLKRVVRILGIALIAAVILIGQRWHTYVTNTTSPYDEVGIELNRYMPYPLRKWGCDKLHSTFGNVLPPYGCSTGDGKQWI